MIYYFTIYGKLLRAETEVKKRHFLDIKLAIHRSKRENDKL